MANSGSPGSRIIGDSSNNNLIGTSGDDSLDGRAGIDTLAGGIGDDLYIVDSITDTLIENVDAGIDTVQSSVNFTLGNNFENLALTGSNAINATGNVLANILRGNDGNNILDGGAGVDTLAGGLGNDTYIVDRYFDSVGESANAGTDTVISSAFSFELSFNIENLTLTGDAVFGFGNSLNNVLTGNNGNNELIGGLGTDTLIGGLGDDGYTIDSSDDIVENANEGIDTIFSFMDFTLANNFENLTLTGNDLDINSIARGTGNALDNALTGDGRANVLTGLAGNDTLIGVGGIGEADTLIGGTGDDTYGLSVSFKMAILRENAGEGIDTVVSPFNFTLANNFENLVLSGVGKRGVGNAADNLMSASGRNTLIGGAGNDTYRVDPTASVIEGANAGIDTVETGVSYTLGSNLENLTLTGASAINATGNTLNNVLTGNSANNTLDGGVGNDTLQGNAGNDLLKGNTGNDSYTGFSTSTGADIINDLSGTSDSANFASFNTSAATWTAIDSNDAGSNVDQLLINFGNGFSVLIEKYFSNTNADDDLSAAGSGLIESLVFSNDSNVTFAEVQALIA